MSELLAELVAKITADATELKKALTESEKGMADLGKETRTQTKAIAKNFETMGKSLMVIGGAITASMGLMMKSFISVGSELHDLSLKTGVTVESLAGLKYAAEQNGASLGTVEMAIRRTASAMQDAKDGLAETQRAFDRMGLSLTALEGLNPEQQFLKIASAIAEIPDPMTRAATALDLFGRSGTDMLPMLSEGAEGLKRMMEEGMKLSGWTTEGANKADEFGDALTTLKTALGGVSNAIGEQLAPILTDYANAITNILKGIKELASISPNATKEVLNIGMSFGESAISIGIFLYALSKIGGFLSKIGMGLGKLTGLLTIATGGFWLMNQGFEQLGRNSAINAAELEMQTEQQKALNGETNNYNEALGRYIESLREYTKSSAAWMSKKDEQYNYDLADSLDEVYQANLKVIESQKERGSADYGASLATSVFADETINLKHNLSDTNYELDKSKDALGKIQISFDAATQKVADFEQAINDANSELDALSRPRLEGMQAFEDQLFNIEQQLKELQLQKLQAPEGVDTSTIDAQIDALEKQRDILELTRDITFDPLIRSVEESIETIKGLNEEVTLSSVVARIEELGRMLSPSGELTLGLIGAKDEMVLANEVLQKQLEIVGKLEEAAKGYQTRLNEIAHIIENVNWNLGGSNPSIPVPSTPITGFASGGTVPGAIGQPQLAVVHGGEQIIPSGERNSVNIYVQGSVITERQLGELSLKYAINKGRKDYTTGL